MTDTDFELNDAERDHFGVLADRIVYVKEISLDELPEDFADAAEGLDHMYSVHNSEGEQLALVADRAIAFDLAREHDYSPMTVH